MPSHTEPAVDLLPGAGLTGVRKVLGEGLVHRLRTLAEARL